MDEPNSGEQFGELKRHYSEYKVCDEHYEKLGKVAEVLLDSADRPLYIGIRTSILKPEATLIPMEIARLNDKRRLIEVARPKYDIEHAPTLDEQEEITPEFEDGVRSYFGLPERWNIHGSATHAPRDAGYSGDLGDPLGAERVDLEPGERKESPSGPLGRHLDDKPTPSERYLRRMRTPD